MKIDSSPMLNNITESVARMNDLLHNAINKNMELDDKMMKLSVVSQVKGLGENIDIKS